MSENLVCVKDFEEAANSKLSKTVREYFNSGANYEQTYTDNSDAFKKYRIRPRYMKGVSQVDYSTHIQGNRVTSPIGVSSMSMCRLAHSEGEVGIAKACGSVGCTITVGSMATSSIPEIRHAAPSGIQFFQIFILKDRDLLVKMIREAEQNGFKALVLTIDCSVHGRRHFEMKNRLLVPPHLSLPNFEEAAEQSKLSWKEFVNGVFDATQQWEDVVWLKSITKLPVIVKGVLGAEDAIEAMRCGVDGIWISNHGGRELDTVPATIDVLPEVVAAVNGRCEIYLDGGIRSGLDALKALALGATAVFVGRPVLWGLACSGSSGAEKVLRILLDELCIGMTLSGCKTLEDLRKSKNLVVTQNSYLPKL